MLSVMNEFIEVDMCPVCSTGSFEIAFRKNKFVGKRCTNCNLVYVSPIPVSIHDIYKDDKTSSPSEYYTLSEKYDKETFTKRLALIEKFKSKGKLLDAGCSVGTMLETASTRGWSAVGVEPNPVSVRICRKKNLDVTEDFLNENLLINHSGYFDAVYMGDVLEHAANPIEMLGIAFKSITKGGILAIVTPNFDSFTARLFQIKPLEHLLYFNIKSLKKLLAQFPAEIELIKKTTRKRTMRAMRHSTTFSGRPLMRPLLKPLSFFPVDFFINKIISIFVRDEIIVITRKL